MGRDMVMTVVDAEYEFEELEEHVRDGIIYDLMTKLDISEEEALIMAEGRNYTYHAQVNYTI